MWLRCNNQYSAAISNVEHLFVWTDVVGVLAVAVRLRLVPERKYICNVLVISVLKLYLLRTKSVVICGKI